jgi:hypothetical protein
MEELRSVCRNPWCKATFIYTENDMIIIDGIKMEPKECNKCESFCNELSGGVTWKDKDYEGGRFNDQPNQIIYKINKYF